MKKWRPDLFITWNDELAVQLIESARERLILVTPSLSLSVAEQIVAQSANQPTIAVKVIIDPNYDPLQLGYGELAAISYLKDHEIDVRAENGIRISVLIVDNRSWVYAPTAHIIEESPEVGIAYNAMLLSPEYTRWLLKSLSPDTFIHDEIFEDLGLRSRAEDPKFPIDLHDDEQLEKEFLEEERSLTPIEISFEPELGKEPLLANAVAELAKEHEERPPRQFDREREILVYNGYLQFVELNFAGARLASTKVRLPRHLLSLIAVSEARIDIEASCRLFEDAENLFPDVRTFEYQLQQLRKDYLVSLGPLFGSVILRKRWSEFEKKLDEHQTELTRIKNTLTKRLTDEVLTARERIVPALVRILLDSKAPWASSFADESSARGYVEKVVDQRFPDPEGLVSGLHLSCLRKDVTWEMLNCKEFGEAIIKAFPREKFTKLYEERNTIGERSKEPRLKPSAEAVEWPELFGGDEDV